MNSRDEMRQQARDHLDPVRRSEMARDRIRAGYAAYRGQLEEAAKARETKPPEVESESICLGPMPDGERLPDGTVRLWDDEDRRRETERREQIKRRTPDDDRDF